MTVTVVNSLKTKADEKSCFDAYTQEKLTRNFTWIHFCSQEILNFDDDCKEEKYYVIIFESAEKI